MGKCFKLLYGNFMKNPIFVLFFKKSKSNNIRIKSQYYHYLFAVSIY